MINIFKNAGGKLKAFAMIIFGISVVVSLILTLILCKTVDVFGILAFPALVFIDWLSVIVLYAFGELCENVQKIAEKE